MTIINEIPIISGKRYFVRCDLDVDTTKDSLTDAHRLESGLETLKYIREGGGIPVIAGHIGKPEGKEDPSLSTKALIPFYEDKLGIGKFELLENLRFDPREEGCSNEYAQELAKNIDFYVNEAFAVSHRKHTSIVEMPKILPSYAGIRLSKEIETLSKALSEPKRPFVTIIGGIKLESKLPIVNKFLEEADFVLLGGKLGLSWNYEIPENLLIPSDYKEEEKDIGDNTIRNYIEIIERANTILWAGPLGAFESEGFEEGTKTLVETLMKKTLEGANVIAGGGDTIEAIQKFGSIEKIGFVSTGGGAMLNFIADGTLPGIEELNA